MFFGVSVQANTTDVVLICSNKS